MIVAVASENPAKLRAVASAFSHVFPETAQEILSVPVESGVGPQPMNDRETLQGAWLRAERCREARPDGSFWVGIEGGVASFDKDLAAFAWVVVLGADQIGRARTGTFLLPRAVTEWIERGLELGEADDRVFGCRESKRDQGAVGLLTGGLIDRTELYAHAVVLALVPFRNETLYPTAEVGEPK
jgi:inosine/xanthosine triphosphatase